MFNPCRGGVAGFVGVIVLIVGVPSARAGKMHPAEEFQLKSHQSSNAETVVTFANKTHQVLRVFWPDFEGKRRLYKGLSPGEEYNQPTYVGHPWVITDVNDNALDLIFPELEARAVDISFREGPRTRFALSRDGRMMAFASRANDVPLRLYETATGQSRLAESVPLPPVESLIFLTPEVLAAVGSDGTVSLHEVRTGKLLERLKGEVAPESQLVASADGRRLEARAGGKVQRQWDTTPWAALGPKAMRPEDELSASLQALAADDVVAVYRAMGDLVARPGPAKALVFERLGRARPAKPERLKLLIAQLDSDTFRVREQATRELEELEFSAAPALREALTSPSLEVCLRASRVLDRLPGELLLTRMLEVLEHIGAADDEALESVAGHVSDTYLSAVRAAARRVKEARGQ